MTSNSDVIFKIEATIPGSGTQFVASLLLFFPKVSSLYCIAKEFKLQIPLGMKTVLGLLLASSKISSCVYFQKYFACDKGINLGGPEGKML